MNNLEKILDETPKVIKVFKKAKDVDGFSVELQNGEIIDISGTQWQTSDYKRSVLDKTLFQTSNKEIVFTEQLNLLANDLSR